MCVKSELPVCVVNMSNISSPKQQNKPFPWKRLLNAVWSAVLQEGGGVGAEAPELAHGLLEALLQEVMTR